MCNCVELIKKNREKIVVEALKKEIIRGLVSKVKEQDIQVERGGGVHVEYSFEIDERVTNIAYDVVDGIIELLEDEDEV